MKSWIHDNDIEVHSTQNEEQCVVAERYIRTIQNKIFKYMTSVSKNVYIDKLADIVNEYKNTYHSKIKMKPSGVKSSTYTDFCTENNE